MACNDNSSFVDFLAEILPRISIQIQGRSYNAYSKEKILIRGVEDIYDSYYWKSCWVDDLGIKHQSSDRISTSKSLNLLSTRLKNSLEARESEELVFSICQSIIDWGGGRRSKGKGADRLISSLRNEGKLISYLMDCKKDFSLEQDSLPKFSNVVDMNSMLSKVHSLASSDGLPIYDTRVSATTCMLAELYKKKNNLNSIPTAVAFPTSARYNPKRDISIICANADKSFHLYSASKSRNVQEWSQAKWRLGKIFTDILYKNPSLFKTEKSHVERMRAMEASFFMIGYDLKSISIE